MQLVLLNLFAMRFFEVCMVHIDNSIDIYLHDKQNMCESVLKEISTKVLKI